ncbi:MAG: hypothetical protein E7016_07150 [Alphaproteobacteria bacterium]|nr:hypothetical protein [Alphaproteobacteria bacterium]
MTDEGFIIMMTIIAALMGISYLRFRKEEKQLKIEEMEKKQNLSDEQLLNMKIEDLCKLSHDDLKKLVDYAGHRMVETSGDEKARWGKLFEDASAALFGYH